MAGSPIIEGYAESLRKKFRLFVVFLVALAVLAVFSVGLGSFDVSPLKVVATLLGYEEGPAGIVIWNIRMPRIISAIVAGWGLGVSGAVIQCVLKNPLGSPFTLGISHGGRIRCCICHCHTGGRRHSVRCPQDNGNVPTYRIQCIRGDVVCVRRRNGDDRGDPASRPHEANGPRIDHFGRCGPIFPFCLRHYPHPVFCLRGWSWHRSCSGPLATFPGQTGTKSAS